MRSRPGSRPATVRRPRSNLAAAAAAVLLALLSACSGTEDAPAPTPSSGESQPQERGDAERVAREALTTWAQPDLPYQQWWDQVEPLLTPSAREDYSYTDPAVIPPLEITGEAEEEAEPYDPNVTTFYYETTEGRFGVDVARDPEAGQWQAFSIVFPDGQSMRQ